MVAATAWREAFFRGKFETVQIQYKSNTSHMENFFDQLEYATRQFYLFFCHLSADILVGFLMYSLIHFFFCVNKSLFY